MYYGWTFVLLLPAMLLSLFAQLSVSMNFKKYSKHGSRRMMTGADAARLMLSKAGVTDVTIEETAGQLTDHYDPRSKTLRLSQPVFNSRSIAAQGVAAHEAGHAIQHATGYLPLSLRSFAIPAANFGSKLAWPLLIIGFMLPNTFYIGGDLLVNAAIVLYAAFVFVSIVTLPVEFNASRRAKKALLEYGILDSEEISGAKKVLSSAALTYVASATTAVITFVRIFLTARANKRNV